MTFLYLSGFVSVLVVSFISLIGTISLSLKEETLKKYLSIFVSLAVGGLLGGAFIHLIPEASEAIGNSTKVGLLVIGGIILFFIVEKLLHWHHHGEDAQNEKIHPVGKLILLTDGFHNLIDGIIIGVSFLVSAPIGIATTLAVILHEIPQEIGDFAVLIHSGYSKEKALLYNFLSALTSVIGLILAFIFGSILENFTVWVLPIAAGGFIYIAIADLIPELQKTKKINFSIGQFITILVGILCMIAMLLLE